MIYLIFVTPLVLLLSIQTTFLRIFFPENVAPDLILIVAVYFGIHLKKNNGILLAALIGFFQDCLSGGVLGVNFLSKGLAGLFFCVIKDKIIVEGIMPIGLFMFAASLVDGMIYFLSMTSLLKGSIEGDFIFSSLIIFGIFNAVVAPFLFYIFDKGMQWLHRKFPSQLLESI
ncbi:MAG TPA: rod shape-determining protein MreD [Nitrospinaceae bacterium]|jgi:rod shape-determining protein MreD|nr:rod shape-determining protein MreD [Nitrospinaceae bacterium]